MPPVFKPLILLCTTTLMGMVEYQASIAPIGKSIEWRMRQGNTYHDGCPVPLRDLRYLRLTYRGFDGKTHTGELIVHKAVASDVKQIFGDLYRIKYPIRC